MGRFPTGRISWGVLVNVLSSEMIYQDSSASEVEGPVEGPSTSTTSVTWNHLTLKVSECERGGGG